MKLNFVVDSKMKRKIKKRLLKKINTAGYIRHTTFNRDKIILKYFDHRLTDISGLYYINIDVSYVDGGGMMSSFCVGSKKYWKKEMD